MSESPALPSALPSRLQKVAPAPKPINVVLIDDNRIQREGLSALIHAQPGFCMLVASADVDEALEKVRDRNPNVVLLHLGLDDVDCLTLAATVRGELPDAHVIIMGVSPSQGDVAEFVTVGVAGFITKDASFEEYVETVRTVAAGGQVLPVSLTNSLFDSLASRTGSNAASSTASPVSPDTPADAAQVALAEDSRQEPVAAPTRPKDGVRLTNREREVIDLLSEGMSNREIAERLGIALHTVKSHVHSVLEKLSLNSRLQVAAFTHSVGGSKAIGL